MLGRATIQVVESIPESISPHTCGAVSLLLSGLKAQSVPYSPFSVKRALANTARPLRNHCQYAQGHGLLQVRNLQFLNTSWHDKRIDIAEQT